MVALPPKDCPSKEAHSASVRLLPEGQMPVAGSCRYRVVEALVGLVGASVGGLLGVMVIGVLAGTFGGAFVGAFGGAHEGALLGPNVDGALLGAYVSPALVGANVDGAADGTPVGTLVGIQLGELLGGGGTYGDGAAVGTFPQMGLDSNPQLVRMAHELPPVD